MREIQVLDCFCHVPRLFRIDQPWLTFPNGAEATMTRADVAAEHERGGTIVPTLEDVRTTGFLADGVQIEAFNQLQHLVLIGWITQANTEPFGLRLADLLIVADYTEFAGQLFTSAWILRASGRERKWATDFRGFAEDKTIVCASKAV